MSKTFERRCSIKGCDRKYYAKGFCNPHYNRARLGTDLTRPWHSPARTLHRDMTCAFEGCDRVGYSKGICHTHYMQYWLNGKSMDALKPIRTYSNVRKDETGQTCRTCDKHKPWTEFYKRSDSDSYQTECRSCQRDRRTRNWEAKNGPYRQRVFAPRKRRVE